MCHDRATVMRRKRWQVPRVRSTSLYSDVLAGGEPSVAPELPADVIELQNRIEWLWREHGGRSARLQAVIDAVQGFVCVKELGGRFVLSNRCLADAYGTTPDGLVGKSDYDFNPDVEQVDGFVAADREVICGRVPKHIRAERFTTSSGEQRWLRTTKIPLLDERGACTRLLAIAIDVTEQVRRENDVRKAGHRRRVARNERRGPRSALETRP